MRLLPIAIALCCACFGGGSPPTLIAPRGKPQGAGPASPPSCDAGCFQLDSTGLYTRGITFFPDGDGGATAWIEGMGASANLEGTTYPMGVNEVEIRPGGTLGSFNAYGGIPIAKLWRTDLGLLLSGQGIAAGASAIGNPLSGGNRAAVVPLTDAGVLGPGQPWAQITTGVVTGHAVNKQGEVLWTSMRGHRVFVDGDPTERVGYPNGNVSDVGFAAVLAADRSLKFLVRIPDVTEDSSSVFLEDDGNAFFTSKSDLVWDAGTLTTALPGFTTRGYIARATSTGPVGWAVPVVASGQMIIGFGPLVGDGAGGAWAVVTLAMPALGMLSNQEQDVRIGTASVQAPAKQKMQAAVLVHIDESGLVLSAQIPFVTNPTASVNVANIVALEPAPDRGVLVLGDVQSTNASGSATVHVQGGPVDVGGALTASSGVYLAHVHADGTGAWARNFSSFSANGAPGILRRDGDFVWVFARGYGEISWDTPPGSPVGTPLSAAALLRVRWR